MLSEDERDLVAQIIANKESDSEAARSLFTLCRLLRQHHGRGVVVLIDEYDAPVMAAYTNGYYHETVDFLKGLLTGALKDGGEALAFACLTGVQRISKESIFSDLNNLRVSTSLSSVSDERYGFSDQEVSALTSYCGYGGADNAAKARAWYDGYRFGSEDVYNPWSVLNYIDAKCHPGVFWTNTSSNEVVGEAIRTADEQGLRELLTLLEPGGVIWAPLDLSVVFPDVGMKSDALWSMLYLAGYLTSDDTDDPEDTLKLRPLRIPNVEISNVFRTQIIDRFASHLRLA